MRHWLDALDHQPTPSCTQSASVPLWGIMGLFDDSCTQEPLFCIAIIDYLSYAGMFDGEIYDQVLDIEASLLHLITLI